jgi:hypothetical protein
MLRALLIASLASGCGRSGFQTIDASADTLPPCELGPFGPPQNLGAGINSDAGDLAPALRGDGLELIFASNRLGSEDFDLYAASRGSIAEPWTAPQRLAALVTATRDTDPAFSDELTLYFVNVTDAMPRLHVSTRASLAAPWGPGELVPELAVEEIYGPAITAGQSQLFYNRGEGGTSAATSPVMFRAHHEPVGWVTDGPVTEINQGYDGYPSFTADGFTIYFESRRSGSPTRIYRATRPTWLSVFGPAEPIDLASEEGADDYDPEISADGRSLLFASRRAEGSGMTDLWVATRTCL